MKIEADVSSGMPYFNMVGLLSSEVKEARERVRTAIKNSGIDIPSKRITVNLSPADIKKEGSAFDLPIAVALLCSIEKIKSDAFDKTLIIGELGLDGDIKSVKGVLPIVDMASKKGFKKCIVPLENYQEAKIINSIEVIPIKNLRQFIDYADFKISVHELQNNIFYKIEKNKNIENILDFNQIYGQESIKRSVCIAVAGKHNLLMIGPPGSGKSMIASRIPSIMPDMTLEESLVVSNIHSICGKLENGKLITKRPFRSPHHTITSSALVGGGKYPKPGELTLANKGILFLDELPEFSPSVIDNLRQPMENKSINIVRLGGNYEFPADSMIVVAMNPCRCGYYPDRNKCNCSLNEINSYIGRISGPFLDRIDMCTEVGRVRIEEVEEAQKGKSSKEMKELIMNAIYFRNERGQNKYNSELFPEEIKQYCELDKKTTEFIHTAYQKYNLTMRGYYKILKTARTIADISNKENIDITHISEALAYRTIDKKYWK